MGAIRIADQHMRDRRFKHREANRDRPQHQKLPVNWWTVKKIMLQEARAARKKKEAKKASGAVVQPIDTPQV